ncbi:MAG: ATP-binding protein [Terriglobales bacterium]
MAAQPYLEAHRCLQRAAPELLGQWRRRFPITPRLQAAARKKLEQLLIPPLGAETAGLTSWREQVQYSAARLAKMEVPLSQVNAAFAAFRPLALARLRRDFDAETAAAAQQWLQQQTQLAVAEAFVAAKNNAVRALLAVLDAELSAATLDQLLQVLLQQAARLFPVRWGEILLLEAGGERLHHAASFGLAPEMILDTAGAGAFFQRVLQENQPGFLLDAANDPGVAQPYYRALEVKSVWAVPLQAGAEPLGILSLAFDRVYECLPGEKDLLLALAQRSTLAIERTRMRERLEQQRARVMELSRRLLDAHDEERRRISRDLHDETGQALLALRLYLEMGLRQPPEQTREWLHKGLMLVDSSVAELRRIMAELSPLALDELGLEAALRQALRRLRAEQGWSVRFHCALGEGALDRKLEILIYRVVVEGLRNAARHARARSVRLRIRAARGQVCVHLLDDGVGLSPESRRKSRAPGSGLGLAGIRERVRLAGGRFEVRSQPGQGVHLAFWIPLNPAVAASLQHE